MTDKNKIHRYEKGIVLRLFLTFFRIGLFTFGGGYAMLPLISADVVEKRKWITADEMVDMLAIAESTPGPFAINAATFVGSRMGGFAGATAATLGVVLPSFVIILIVSVLFEAFRDNHWVDAAFRGIRAGVVVLIINAVIKLAKKQKWSLLPAAFAVGAFALSMFTELSVIWALLFGGVAGIAWQLLRKDGAGK